MPVPEIEATYFVKCRKTSHTYEFEDRTIKVVRGRVYMADKVTKCFITNLLTGPVCGAVRNFTWGNDPKLWKILSPLEVALAKMKGVKIEGLPT